MSNIPLNPECIGSLTYKQSVDFSLPFRHDWQQFSSDRFNGSDGVLLNNSDEDFGLPANYAQFLPAIHLVAEHEASVRDVRKIADAVLTIRQCFVEARQSQQDGSMIGKAHQDHSVDEPSRFYTISDVSPTEFFPELQDKQGDRLFGVPIPPDEPTVHFNPYDIVVASGATYHRSPPLQKSTVRTFMRLSYLYEQ